MRTTATEKAEARPIRSPLTYSQAVRELGVTILRWPGGNFASAYHWTDGIGPAAERSCSTAGLFVVTERRRYFSRSILRDSLNLPVCSL